VITLAGDEIAGLVNGSVVIEVIFGWPGIGQLAISAIERRDLPLIQADVLIVAAMVVFINLVVDLAYAYLDPRIRYA
jgi:peptide/nickel transport system permease protein